MIGWALCVKPPRINTPMIASLIAKETFGPYTKGDLITDQQEVASLLAGDQAHYVLQILTEAPQAEPEKKVEIENVAEVTTEESPNIGDDNSKGTEE